MIGLHKAKICIKFLFTFNSIPGDEIVTSKLLLNDGQRLTMTIAISV